MKSFNSSGILRAIVAAAVVGASSAVVSTAYASTSSGTHDSGGSSEQGAGIIAIAQSVMKEDNLRSVILRVTVDGQEVVTSAMGESRAGQPATPNMHFRNGAVAISYIATLLLELVDKGTIALDDPLSRWLPELPDADRVTLRMLAMMTAGYPDYVQNALFVSALYKDPHRQWTPDELINIGLSTPRIFDPGTNWDYAHTNYVILGRALERITGKPMATLMQEGILQPLHLGNTRSVATPAIQRPVLRAFTSERREILSIPSDVPFYEDSTYWNPSWTLAEGAIQTTNIYDMEATAVAVGTGSLLSAESHAAQIAPTLLDFGQPVDGCPSCHKLTEAYDYGIGVVLTGQWVLQHPLFFGYGSIEAYLPSRKIAIAVAVTFGEQGFDDKGNNLHERAAVDIFRQIAEFLTGIEVPH